MTFLFGIVGWKNSGKTGLVVRLIKELSSRGLTVSTIKHAHDGFNLDQPGTDSDRHSNAGARKVAIISDKRWAIMHELSERQEPPGLSEIAAGLGSNDIILVEGFKSEPHPKIEVRRQEALETTPMIDQFPNICAIAADWVLDKTNLPVFQLDDTVKIADFIVSLKANEEK